MKITTTQDAHKTNTNTTMQHKNDPQNKHKQQTTTTNTSWNMGGQTQRHTETTNWHIKHTTKSNSTKRNKRNTKPDKRTNTIYIYT